MSFPPGAGRAEAAQPPTAALDEVFREWDRDDSPGCAAGALRRGAFVFQNAYGMANLDHAVPLTPDSIFRMASVSKQFTVAAVLVAEDQGLLSLEDPLRKHFPDLPDWADPVRIRHLVHHTSGIRDYLVVMALRGLGDDAYYTDADVLQALRQLERLNFEPGSEYLYSNSGFWLLARLIHRTSGKTLREFAAEHLLGPVGMTASHFHDRQREIVPGRATGYRPRPEAEGGGFEVDATTLEMVGDGGLYTSVNELRHWERMFLDPAALGPDLLHRLVAPGRFNDGSVQDYAGGLGLGEYRGARDGFPRRWIRRLSDLCASFPRAGVRGLCAVQLRECRSRRARPPGRGPLSRGSPGFPGSGCGIGPHRGRGTVTREILGGAPPDRSPPSSGKMMATGAVSFWSGAALERRCPSSRVSCRGSPGNRGSASNCSRTASFSGSRDSATSTTPGSNRTGVSRGNPRSTRWWG